MRFKKFRTGPIQSRWTEITALQSNKHSECVIITHPFHPLTGSRLKKSSSKSFNNNEILRLETESGKLIAIPREWTDRADVDLYQSFSDSPPSLSFTHLLQLVEFTNVLKQAKSKKLKG